MAKALPTPTEIRVAGKRYAVAVENMRGDCGQVQHKDQLIILDENQHADALRDTLLHEVLHCLDWQMLLELEENQVHALAAGILEVLWANPEAAKWLLVRA